MVEVLSVIGMCLGGLSFILSTLPAAARVRHTDRERSQHIRELKVRLAGCFSQFNCLDDPENEWANDIDRARLADILLDIEDLKTKMCSEIEIQLISDSEKKTWSRVKAELDKGRYSTPRRWIERLCDNIRYDLWHKDTLDRWMTRLEKSIDAIDKILRNDAHERTDQFLNTAIVQSRELTALESFATKLLDLGTRLYERCTREPGTDEWAIGLRPPEENCGLSSWNCPTPIRIEFRFSVQKKIENDPHYRLRVTYEEDNSSDDTIEEAIDQIARKRDSRDSETVNDVPLPNYTKCWRQDDTIRRTLSIGHLLENLPRIFENDAWYEERAALVFGISEWSLLLWNTPWLKGLCCHGLTLELAPRHLDLARQIYEWDDHKDCQLSEQSLKLRNLGLVWAQLILGQPIRPTTEKDPPRYSIKTETGWEPVQRAGINEKIILATASKPLQEAINFCLHPKSLPPDSDFKTGYLLKCIEKMHKL